MRDLRNRGRERWTALEHERDSWSMDAPAASPIGLTLAQVAHAEGVHPGTVWRWCRRGIVAGGRRHRLPYLQRGRAIRLDPGAVREWAARVASARQEADAARDPDPPADEAPAPGPRRRASTSPAGAQRAHAAAERRARARLGMDG